jgi:hypothetical protein
MTQNARSVAMSRPDKFMVGLVAQASPIVKETRFGRTNSALETVANSFIVSSIAFPPRRRTDLTGLKAVRFLNQHLQRLQGVDKGWLRNKHRSNSKRVAGQDFVHAVFQDCRFSASET